VSAPRVSKGLLAVIVVAAGAAVAAWLYIGTANGDGRTGVRIVEIYPHDANAFTQGLVAYDGKLLEGTGQYGGSSLRQVDIETGRVERLVPLSDAYFGEGITVLGDRVFQLTWRSRLGFVYDVGTFKRSGTFRFDGEGWGLTHDGTHLILSDGTATLRYIDPETFAVDRQIVVRDGDLPVVRLNELEYVDGEIWANVWYDDRIVRIDPATGDVLGWIDLASLYPPGERGRENVLNGIAYDAGSGRLFVTGKNWPRLFEIEVEGLR
jgi:glutaminyl-peptide cyclotransferase